MTAEIRLKMQNILETKNVYTEMTALSLTSRGESLQLLR